MYKRREYKALHGDGDESSSSDESEESHSALRRDGGSALN